MWVISHSHNSLETHVHHSHATLSLVFLFHYSLCFNLSPLLKVLEKGGPFPQVILPQFGGYWIEDVEAPAGTPSSSESSFCEEEDGGEGMSPGGGHSYRLECNSTARAYRKHFLGKVSESVSMFISLCLLVCFTQNVSQTSRNTWTTTALAAASETSSCLWNTRRRRDRSFYASCSGKKREMLCQHHMLS